MQPVTQFLTDSERQAIRAPIHTARTFPRRAFTDPEYFEFEKEHALSESWVAAGFSVTIPDVGDVMPMTVLGYPIILVRGQDSKVRAFHNICPYDGCEVSIAPQSGLEQIETPYHGWHYSLDGRLIKAGYWDGTPDAESLNLQDLNADLKEIPCHEWLQTLFVYLGKKPVQFADQFQAVLSHLSAVDLDRVRIGSGDQGQPLIQELKIKANWKTVYENYSPNVYHESFVHEMYRKSPHSPRVDSDGVKTYTEINYACGFLGLCYDNEIGGSFYGDSNLPPIRNKDGTANSINTIANAYPNWVVTMLGDAARISIFLPEAADCGTQIVATYFDQEGADDEAFLVDRKQSERKGIMARIEDNRICESIQRARHSPAFETQFYSPFWDNMHYTMNNLILDKLEQAE